MNSKERKENIIKLYDDREKRLTNLVGNYVIICNGYKSKETVYLQSKEISTTGWWTKYLANARFFETKESAELILKTLRYNNPEVLLITEEYLNEWKTFYWEKFLEDMQWE